MTPQPLDKDVINLAKAIRQVESNNRPVHPQEGSGFGGASRYQYSHETWKEVAQKFLGDPNAPLTLENENKATYYRIKQWKDAGKTPAQIVSMWNAGEDDPNAYRGVFDSTGKPSVGVNEYGVKYDVPGHVQKVRQAYEQIKMGGQAVPAGGTYAAPPQPKTFEPSAPPVPEEEKGFGRKAAEFLFPILEDKERTGAQTAADLGLSALTVIPGAGALGLGAKAALGGGIKGVLKGLVPKIMDKSAVLKGTGIGYGYDVLSNISEGDTGAEALTPGLGTLTGAGAPLIAGKLKGTKSVQKVLDDEALKEASDLVSPTLTKKNVKEGLKKGLATKTPGIRGDIGMDLDIRKQRAAESIKYLLKTGALKSSDTVEKKVGVIRAEIADTAEELEQQLKDMDIVPIVQPDELQNLLKKTEDIFEESPALVGDAGLSAKRIYNKFVSFIPKGQDVTALDLLRARKKLDQWVASEGRTGAFDPKLETAISKGLREIRQGANELLAEKAPNVQVQDMLRKQSSMYDALDGIIENEWKDVGTTRVGRYFKRHPYQKDVVRGALTTAGATAVGAPILGQFLGDKATN